MAVYLLMKKISEDEKTVVYQFRPNEKTIGKIEFNKELKKSRYCSK